MNIYEKIQNVKEKILKDNLKKTGKNKFAGFDYYELSDITPSIIKHCNEEKLFTRISFGEYAELEIINIENPEERIVYTSPIEELELKGCNKLQALGGVETYSRRYLYFMAFDIIENDLFDATSGEVEEEKASEKQISTIKRIVSEDRMGSFLTYYKIEKIEDISKKDASDMISRLMKNDIE